MNLMKIALITGITGQDGSYLSELLLEKQYKVYGIVRRNSQLFQFRTINHIRDKLYLRYGDMTDSSSIHKIINDICKDNAGFERLEIYNLAAQSHVQISFDIPEYTANTDAFGVLYLLQAITSLEKNIKDKIRFYQAGTSELYGRVLQTPQNEDTPFNPVSPYAVAKQFGHYITKVYRDAYGLYAVNGILFNHESSRRGYNFVTMKIVQAVKRLTSHENDKKNAKEILELGNLDSKRDWGHAKDYVHGMWLMLQQDPQKAPIEDFVLATGRTYTIRKFVERAYKYAGYDIIWKGDAGTENEYGVDQYGDTRVKINPKHYRPNEVDLLLGDSKKAQEKLGWIMRYDTLDKLIEEMFS
tara:strand:- start:1258 stop:2325 length:1068 start_codon:yes stop_codon:yes gene_type:complete